jgi:acetyl esterase/lipase
MQHMASRGWLCVAPNYRLSPRHAFPAHLVDVKCAIAWVRAHAAEYGADPDFIAVTGGSAGAHLAALAALTPNDPEYQPGFEGADTRVQAAVPFYGVYDFAGITGPAAARMRDTFLGPLVVRRDPRRDLTPFQKASPICQVRPDAPPFYVIHGVNDTLVPIDQARRFVEALREVSESPVAYVELRGAQHAFDLFPSVRSQHSVRSADLFLRWVHDRWTSERLADAAGRRS